MKNQTLSIVAALALATVAGSTAVARQAPAANKPGTKLDFARDIRPVLSDKCFACHGPDASKRKAKLRLDEAESAFKLNAFVAADLDASEAYQRIISKDPEEVMPPPKHGKPLSKDEIAKIRMWIEQGANYARHWSFVPPVKAPLPSVKNLAWCRNPIDRFVLARLEKEGLTPSPEADKVTLLRRVSLDLIGLPPTIGEVDAFLADKDERAYERQVERLLRSPHYGERWARLWLDAARYADSDGYEKDKARQVWFYRDWVIRSLNHDLPYDRFITEQLAGDLLPGASQDQIVATGFLRNSMINEEGGVDPEQFRMEAMFDRMDAIGKSILGLTIQCGQCHSHKYDPLMQEEYYRMFAYLNNSDEANIEVFTPEQQMARAEVLRKIRELEDDLKHKQSDWPEKMAAWEAKVQNDQPAWVVPPVSIDDISTGGQKYHVLPDGSILAQGYAPTKHTVKITLRTDLKEINALRLEMLNDANLPRGGPGRSVLGTGALSEIEILAASAAEPGKTTRVKLIKATADLNPPEAPLDKQFDDRGKKKRTTGPVSFAIDGKDDTAWTNDGGPGRRNLPRKAVFTFEKPVSFPKGTVLTVNLKQNHGGWNSDDNQNCNLGRFRLSLTSARDAVADPLTFAARESLNVPPEKRIPAQVNALFSYWRTTVPDWKQTNEKIEALWKSHPEGTTQLILHDKEAHPRTTHMLQRGDFLKPTAAVRPGVPGFLNPLPRNAPANRLAFAQWLTDRQSPTTARAIVNRIWQADFGIGFVATSEDLGSQGESPTHPELLDWLAVELMDNGWSLKHLHKLIVTSSTYRQASNVTAELQARDPYNRLLARGPRFRVDAEIVRDVALEASGLLDPAVGGPSVYPPAPAFLFLPPVSYGPKVWSDSKGPEKYRRALYTFRYRSVPYPALQNFDAPNGDFSCVKRARSNTPLQALTTLNEPVFLDCARSLALLTLEKGGSSDATKVEYAFRRCLSRKPTEAESKVLLGLLAKEVERFSKPGAKPWELAAADPAHPPKLKDGETPARLAAWTAVARVLLNLDETITKE